MRPQTLAQSIDAIARADRALLAWTFLDAHARSDAPGGPLADLTFGVKDIIDVRGMPTRLGLSDDAPPARTDAWCVAALRAAGAVPIGKTATTAFAWRDPAATLHPHVAGATPGGSSAGSAAAVAAGHVPLALGTQTVGSTLRPAAYCGVVGYKPTYGLVPVFGASPLAPSVDHIGAIARDVATAARFAAIFGVEPIALDGPPRLAFAGDAFADLVGDDVRAALAAAIARCRAGGARVTDATLPQPFFATFELLEPLVAYEAFAVHGARLGDPLPPQFAALLERGRDEPATARANALHARNATHAAIAAALAGFDAVLLATADPAPDRATTGGDRLQAPATFYGLPAITIPIARDERGRSIGVQLISPRGSDATLLATAAWIEACLDVAKPPPLYPMDKERVATARKQSECLDVANTGGASASRTR